MDCPIFSPASQAAPVAVALPPKATRPLRPARTKVLVELHSDGWVEVYADPHVDVYIVQRPHVTSPASASLVDELLESRMPRCYRSLFYPNKLRAADLCRKVTPEQMLDMIGTLAILRGIQAIADMPRLVPAQETTA